MKKCPVKFYTKENIVYWACPNNMGYQTPRKLSITKCWKYNCPGRCAPSEELFCSFEECNNLRRPGSKYCDDKCRKRNSRKAYVLRKQQKAL